MDKQNLVIVGAGAAGLMAALELSGHYNIVILEARDRVGGRIYSQKSTSSSIMIETAAEFIHGNLPLTLQLLKEAGIRYLPMEGNMYRKEKGKWNEQSDMVEGWDKLIKEMGRLEKDMTMQAFLQQYYGDDKYTELRRHITAFAEGFDIADVKKVSVKSLYREWSHEQDTNYRIPEGYGSMILYLQQEIETRGGTILTSHTVKQIDWEDDGATVYTADEQQFDADKVIITIPLRLLQMAGAKGSINFTPALDEYINAANEIGIGAVIKVVLFFKHRFWEKDTGFIFSDEVFPTWWTQLPDPTPVLTGWIGGAKAERLSDHSEDDILEKALLSLGSIYDKSINELKENLVENHVFNWQLDDYSLSAYTYSMPESANARQVLNKPVNNTIFFAGEALYDGVSPGTVEAALVSGKNVAEKIFRNKESEIRNKE